MNSFPNKYKFSGGKRQHPDYWNLLNVLSGVFVWEDGRTYLCQPPYFSQKVHVKYLRVDRRASSVEAVGFDGVYALCWDEGTKVKWSKKESREEVEHERLDYV